MWPQVLMVRFRYLTVEALLLAKLANAERFGGQSLLLACGGKQVSPVAFLGGQHVVNTFEAVDWPCADAN